MQAGRCGRQCLIASQMNTWWKCSHSSIRRDFSWSTSWIWLRYTCSCSFPQIWLAGKFCDEFFAPYPFSCLSTLITTRSSAENTMFIVYVNCLQVTSDCSKQRCIGNQDILSSVFEYLRYQIIFSHEIWQFFHRYIRKQLHIILSRYIQI